MAEAQVYEGKVSKISQREGVPTGLQLEGIDGWLDYSKPEYRKQPWYEPKVGDKVRLKVTPPKWIGSIENIGDNGAVWMPDESDHGAPSEWSFKDKDLSIAKQVCLKAAVEFWAMRQDSTDDHVVSSATKFWAWMRTGDGQEG